MSELPASWTITTLGEITADCAQKIPGETEAFQYIDISSVDRQTKTIVSPQSLIGANAPSRARKLVQTGDVLVSLTRPNLNAVALVPQHLDGQIASTGFDVLRAKGIEPRWIFNAVRTTDFVNTVSDLVQGALYPAIRSKDVRGYEVPLAPLNEQRRIADKLDTTLARVDACRARLDRVAVLLKRFRQSVLAAAVSGKLTEEWREENGVTEEWDDVPLGEILTDIQAGLNVQCTERPPEPGERGLVKISAVTWGTYNDTESKTLPPDNAVSEKLRIRLGDFLISRANTLELVAACVIVERTTRPVYLSDKVLRLVMPNEIKPWVLYVLRSHEGRKQIESLASGNQLSMRNLSQANMRSIRIPLPTSAERTEIVRRVESLFAFADRLEASLATGRTKTDNLTPALLAKAFRGELVPQDPTDEPADVLLERIRAARAVWESGKPKEKGQGRGRPRKTPTNEETAMLKRSDIDKKHLTKILTERGPLTAEALWSASKLEIDDFYDQLKDEEAAELLRERRGDDPKAVRLLEPVA